MYLYVSIYIYHVYMPELIPVPTFPGGPHPPRP